MKEKMLKQFEFSEDLKERIIGLVLYQRQPAKVVAQSMIYPMFTSLPIGSGFTKSSWKREL